MTTTTQENNNVKAVSLLSALLNATDSYDAGLSSLSALYADRAKALEVLRQAGFKSVQSGKSLRYNKDAQPLTGEYPYTVAISEFEARFKALKPNATQKQVDANNKQRIASLNFWLVNGKFTSNVGKDRVRLEHEVASEKFSEASLEAIRANTKAKIAVRQSAENKKLVEQATKGLAKTVAKVKELSASGDIEALKVIEAKAKLESDNLARLKDNLKIADKIANKAQTDKTRADAIANNAKQAQADKAQAEQDKKNKAQDMKKLATELSNKYTAEQITKLIVELQKTI